VAGWEVELRKDGQVKGVAEAVGADGQLGVVRLTPGCAARRDQVTRRRKSSSRGNGRRRRILAEWIPDDCGDRVADLNRYREVVEFERWMRRP